MTAYALLVIIFYVYQMVRDKTMVTTEQYWKDMMLMFRKYLRLGRGHLVHFRFVFQVWETARVYILKMRT